VGVHHVAIAVADLEESVRYFRDGLSCAVVLDGTYEREWDRLVGSPATTMDMVVLVPPDGGCAIELIKFADDVDRPPPPAPPAGLFMLSFVVDDVEATKERLVALGYDGVEESYNDIAGQHVDVTFTPGPEGVMIELVSEAQAAGISL
jgi:catechol 2,3-dioxygenase-like lactoylglutathione lyase family enzyme